MPTQSCDLFSKAMSTILSILVLLIASILVRLIYKVIWIPFRVQSFMRSQGIKGPSYKFLHGSTKESLRLKSEAKNGATDLSHDLFPIVQPSVYTWMNLYGQNFLTWTGAQPRLMITELELVKEILGNKEGLYVKHKVSGALKKFLGDGLMMSDGEKWSKLRKLANHAFYAESLKEMIPAMISSVETMLENWRQYEGKEVDVYREFMCLSSEVISRTAFGSNYLEGKNIFDMLTKLGMLILKNVDKIRPLDVIKVFKSKDDAESDKIDQSLRDSIMEIVRKREDKVFRGEAENFGNDFLGLLLTDHHESDKKNRISMDGIIDECKIFFLAGHETTGTLLSWMFLLLAIHTDWQEKAREEVFKVFGKENPYSEGLTRLKSVSMIINEALRLYNPTTFLVRKTKSKVTLGNYEIPANMELHIPPIALAANTEIWGKDAHLFKPERFSDGVVKATRNNPVAFLSFGFGPRTCVGLNFANNEVKIALSMILQRYKFTLSSNYVHSPVSLITICPKYGVQIMLQPL